MSRIVSVMVFRFVVPLTILILALVVPTESATADGPRGTLNAPLPNAVQSLDPALARDEASRICVASLYDPLYEYHYLERPYRLVPCLATALPEVSDDHLTWTIRLRPGIRYADDKCFPDGKGREVGAADFVFCMKRLMDARVGSPWTWMFQGRIVGLDAFAEASAKIAPDPYRSSYAIADGYPQVPGLEAVDERTLRIRLVAPYPELTAALASGFASLYPPEAVGEYGRQFGRRPVGTGAYVLSLLLPSRVVLVANPTYREDTYPDSGMDGDEGRGMLAHAGERLPLNTGVILTVRKMALTEWVRFLKGGLDMGTVPLEAFDGALDGAATDLLPFLKDRGITLQKTPRMEIFYDAFNLRDPEWGHPAGEKGKSLRRAVCLATDDAWVMQNIYRGGVERVHGPLLPEFTEHDEDFEAPWTRQAGESREEALAAAREELTEGGWGPEEKLPVLVKDVLSDDGSKQVFADQKRQLAEIGLEIRPNYVSFPELMTRIAQRKARMWNISWEADYPTAQNFLQLFYGPHGADLNAVGYTNAKFDKLYEQALLMPEGDDRTDLYREMQEIVTQDCPWRFRFRRIRYTAMQPWINGYRFSDFGERGFKYCTVDVERRNAFHE